MADDRVVAQKGNSDGMTYRNPEVVYFPEKAVKEAIGKFETPFFLYEEEKIRDRCREFRNAFEKYFPNFWPLYAVKANSNPEILKIVAEEGFGMDCSSPAEAWIAEKLGVKGEYTGNYTTRNEFEFVMKTGNMILNLDDISMIETVAQLGMPETISFRINPGVGEGGGESMVLAGPDAKYGVPFEKASEAYKKASLAGAKHFGIHMMTGTNVPIQKKDYFKMIVAKLLDIVATVKRETGIEIEFLNMGGGFGVPYQPEEESLDMAEVAKSVKEAFDKKCKEYGLKEPRLMAEPGRWISCQAGFLVAKVHVIKDSYKKFVGIDASSNDMPRPSIYNAYHHISVLDSDDRDTEVVSIAGRICENNDQLARDRELPIMKVEDVVVIHNCGAHAFSMGHNYNGRTRSAEYLLKTDGSFKLIRKAETIEDLYKNCLI